MALRFQLSLMEMFRFMIIREGLVSPTNVESPNEPGGIERLQGFQAQDYFLHLFSQQFTCSCSGPR
jgi:hypothetical protein